MADVAHRESNRGTGGSIAIPIDKQFGMRADIWTASSDLNNP
jgi:hypothetical protein